MLERLGVRAAGPVCQVRFAILWKFAPEEEEFPPCLACSDVTFFPSQLPSRCGLGKGVSLKILDRFTELPEIMQRYTCKEISCTPLHYFPSLAFMWKFHRKHQSCDFIGHLLFLTAYLKSLKIHLETNLELLCGIGWFQLTNNRFWFHENVVGMFGDILRWQSVLASNTMTLGQVRMLIRILSMRGSLLVSFKMKESNTDCW